MYLLNSGNLGLVLGGNTGKLGVCDEGANEQPVMKKSRSPLYSTNMEVMMIAFKQRIQPSQLGSISTHYLGIKFNKETDDCLSFWVRYHKSFDKLFVPARTGRTVFSSIHAVHLWNECLALEEFF
jgi:hypothetical protein